MEILVIEVVTFGFVWLLARRVPSDLFAVGGEIVEAVVLAAVLLHLHHLRALLHESQAVECWNEMKLIQSDDCS